MGRARVVSNRAEVVASVRKLADCATMTSPGRHGTIGLTVVRVVAEGLLHRYVLEQKEPGGAPLAKLADSTRKYKARRGYPAEALVRTKKMLDFEQLKGQTMIDKGSVEMVYGLDETQRKKMEYATEGAKNRPARPGYELNPDIERSIDAAVTADLDVNFRAAGCEDA